jgi:hypothetical protein
MEDYREIGPFEISKCAHCQKEIGPHEALCLDCEKMMLSYDPTFIGSHPDTKDITEEDTGR